MQQRRQHHQHLLVFPHSLRRSRTATHFGRASLNGSHIKHKTRRKRRTRCTYLRAAGGKAGNMVSLPIFLVVPEGHIIPCPTNGLLARCNMQLSATEFCHSIDESQLYSTATLRNGNFFGYIMHWGLHRAAVQCRDSIIIRSAIHVGQPNDVGPMTLSAPIHSQCDPHHVWAAELSRWAGRSRRSQALPSSL
jgi:hypothetical protein